MLLEFTADQKHVTDMYLTSDGHVLFLLLSFVNKERFVKDVEGSQLGLI
jgi:hypothetical protein